MNEARVCRKTVLSGQKSAVFLIDFYSNDIHSEAKNKGRNLQNETAELY